jgi:HAD superfamily hydrolase (TIGR01509 family)
VSLAAVIFDFDGVVLDSETPEYESHRRIYERCGVPLTVDEWCGAIGLWTEGHDDQRFVRLCEQTTSAPAREAYHAERGRIFASLVPSEPMRGVRELLLALHDANVPAAIASTAPSRWVVPSAERIGIRSLFRAVVTGDEVARRKPAPDVYLEAARRLGVDPARSIAIEDSGPGIAAAHAAGMKTVAIPHWLTQGHDLRLADLRVGHAGELTLARLAALVDHGPAKAGHYEKIVAEAGRYDKMDALLEHTVDLNVSAVFAWSFWTDVKNWDDPPAQFALDGPFVEGARGTTTLPGQPLLTWHVRDVRPPQSAAIEMEFDRATLRFEWRFDPLPDHRSRMTQRVVLSGENAAAYADHVRSSFEPNLPAGMARLAAMMERAAPHR